MAVMTLNFIFHLIAFGVSGFAAQYEFFHIKIGHQGFPGKFRFLTFWNICFQTFYFGLCVVNDVLGTNSKNPSQRGTLQKLRDLFHASIFFPTAVFVFVSFWSLYAYDRELVFPKAIDAYFPTWLNHLLHTTVLPLTILEKLVSHHHYPRRLHGFLGVGLVAFMYTSIVLLVAYIDNIWVYPVLKVLSLPQRAIFIATCFAFFAIFYVMGEWSSDVIWGRGLRSPKVGKRNRKTFKEV